MKLYLKNGKVVELDEVNTINYGFLNEFVTTTDNIIGVEV